MFRSSVSSLMAFIAVVLFSFTLLLLWGGSEGTSFARVKFEGDQSTRGILEGYRRKRLAATNLPAGAAPATATTATTARPAVPSPGEGPEVVVWISIPGFRGDYVENAETPFFDQLISDGGSTSKMRPAFPCLTFPAHATMATGTSPGTHGIVADRIRLPGGEVETSPENAELLQAEPIWVTATRQGVRTLVHDWPLSQNQAGEHTAAYFLDSYNPDLSDADRLNRALEVWRSDSAGGSEDAPAESEETAEDDATGEEGDASSDKLRLVMLRLTDILDAGLVNGPREPGTHEAVTKTDAALKTFFDTVRDEWDALAPKAANLSIVISTDHGLADLNKNINLGQLLGEEMLKNADFVAHDAIANLFFKNLPESEGERKIFLDNFDGELGKRIYFRTLSREDLPDDWNYVHPERTGDRVLVLKTGYSFVDETGDEPVFDPAAGAGIFGGYGYPIESSIRMAGQLIVAGYPDSPARGDLDEEKGHLALHATVCKLLEIEPAPGAATETLDVD